MKNRGAVCLLLVCCFCLALTAGVFIGRNVNHTPVQLSSVPAASGEAHIPGTTVEKLDINTATAAQLQKLPGIGPAIAQRILDYRQEHGAFASVGELISIEGIGEGRLESILDYITIN